METKGKITKKYESGKAAKIGTSIYAFTDTTKPYLAKLNEGDEVSIEYTKKGTLLLVTKINKTGGETTTKSTENKDTGYKCEDCGASLKDGKYKKCYTCNQKPKPQTEKKEEEKLQSNYGSKTNYGSPEDVAGKEIGCALGAAASSAAGRGFIDDKGEEDPIKAAQWIKAVAQDLLEWIRSQK